MKTLLIVAAGTVLSLSACKKNDAGNDAMGDNMIVANDMGATDANMSENAMASAALPTTAQAFVNAAAASDRFEIESSRMAATSGKSAAVKSFAAKMIAAHTGTTAKLKSAIAGMNPALVADDTLNADQQSMLDGLKGKTGADFDSAYAGAQATGHQKTLDALNAYASNGDNPKLQELAKGMIPTVTAHLNLAKGLK